jgi:nitrogen fixation/metabolism regulation signal transduction histidine kinase
MLAMRDDTNIRSKIPTQYASSERTTLGRINDQNKIFVQNEALCQVVNAIPEIVLILNKNRQIIFANRTVASLIDNEDFKSILGMRPGELLNCEHSLCTPGGCGTTEFCQTCGAVNAILNGQKGIPDIQECRITQKGNHNSLDLRIYVTPFNLNGHSFTIASIMDISNEKRKNMLEKIFLHDIINTASSIRGAAHLLYENEQEELIDYKEMILHLSESLIEDIVAQREIASAEINELITELTEFSSIELLNEITQFYSVHDQVEDKIIKVDPESADIKIYSDRVLLRRVLGNMIKNALEASEPGGLVTASCNLNRQQVSFQIHNDTFIPRLDQLQIFQRSFTTKGRGRGIGTYSIKLFTEKYLNGIASFTSSKEKGTTFTVTCPIDLSLIEI